jgi:ATP-dependent RNA helicase RhlE
VFTRTKHGANRLAEQLLRDGINAAAIHGNKSQGQRIRALDDFKEGRAAILVATEVASRGLDIDELPHVVNYELPSVANDYVHRIGRTGRAGLEGDAISLVCVDELELLAEIEALLRQRIPRESVPGFEVDGAIRPQPIREIRNSGGRPTTRRPMPERGYGGRPRAGDRSGGSRPHVPGRDSGRRPGVPAPSYGRQPAAPALAFRGRQPVHRAPDEARTDGARPFTTMPGERFARRTAGR